MASIERDKFVINDNNVLIISGGHLYMIGTLNRIRLDQRPSDNTIISSLLIKLEGLSDLIDLASNGTSSYALNSSGNLISLNILDELGNYLTFPTYPELPVKISMVGSVVLITNKSSIIAVYPGPNYKEIRVIEGTVEDIITCGSTVFLLKDGDVKVLSLEQKAIKGSIFGNKLDTLRVVKSISINNNILLVVGFNGSVASYRIEERQKSISVVRTERISKFVNCDDLFPNGRNLVDVIEKIVSLPDGVMIYDGRSLIINRNGSRYVLADNLDITSKFVSNKDEVMFNDASGVLYYYNKGKIITVTSNSSFGKRVKFVAKIHTLLGTNMNY